jgi:hypothetical protein
MEHAATAAADLVVVRHRVRVRVVVRAEVDDGSG